MFASPSGATTNASTASIRRRRPVLAPAPEPTSNRTRGTSAPTTSSSCPCTRALPRVPAPPAQVLSLPKLTDSINHKHSAHLTAHVTSTHSAAALLFQQPLLDAVPVEQVVAPWQSCQFLAQIKCLQANMALGLSLEQLLLFLRGVREQGLQV